MILVQLEYKKISFLLNIKKKFFFLKFLTNLSYIFYTDRQNIILGKFDRNISANVCIADIRLSNREK